MNVEKIYSEPTYVVSLTRREMEVLVAVASNTAGTGDAEFLYDLASLADTDDDLEGAYLPKDIDISFTDLTKGMAVDA